MDKSFVKFELIFKNEKEKLNSLSNFNISNDVLKNLLNNKNDELSPRIAFELAIIYNVDYWYFYNDEIEETKNPWEKYPLVDLADFGKLNENIKEIEVKIKNIAKKYSLDNGEMFKFIEFRTNHIIEGIIRNSIGFKTANKGIMNDLSVINNSFKDALNNIEEIQNNDMNKILKLLDEVNDNKSYDLFDLYTDLQKYEMITYDDNRMTREYFIIAKEIQKINVFFGEYSKEVSELNKLIEDDKNDKFLDRIDISYNQSFTLACLYFVNVMKKLFYLVRKEMNVENNLKPLIKEMLDKLYSNSRTLDLISECMLDNNPLDVIRREFEKDKIIIQYNLIYLRENK